MTKDKLKGMITLGTLLGVMGLIFIFFSVRFGTSLADGWLAAQGGFANSSMYELRVEANTNNFS
ncbi:hypothetical protein [Oceanobacillus halophilus]|uniref:Uncharacterized protein n=1 Tax=Oceanobacillus halophilus TaxID=930130 RepID=A0A495A2H9_9BACI|nr:hypothetical protein [Oceanobacillus halophilus]RKQ33272.1 hypothetical protein D8M06_10905 [Oceanobacillus halophilus]